MIRLDAATVLLQWATGGLAFLWVTTRRREVGIGYGWLMRIVFGLLALGALVAGRLVEPLPGRDLAALLTVLATGLALWTSVVRRKAGVAGEHERRRQRSARVAAMVPSPAGSEGGPPASQADPGGRPAPGGPAPGFGGVGLGDVGLGEPGNDEPDSEAPGLESGEVAGGSRREFPPVLDLFPVLIATAGLVVAGLASGGPAILALARTLIGAAFLGAVTDAMLLGHWYLVQPGLGRAPLRELNRWLALTWPLEVGALLWPPGMGSVLSGRVNDGWGGTLGWFWVACAVTTIVLTAVTSAALKERFYSAVMAATGLLYLAILTAFGTDLVARAVLAG